MTFQEALEQAKSKLSKAKEHRITVRKALFEAEKAEKTAIHEVKLLETIFALAQRKAKGQAVIWEWGFEKETPHYFEHRKWREVYRLEMAGFEFVFKLSELINYKIYKWHVTMKGTKIFYGENTNHYDTGYMARKYVIAIDKKFKSEAEARKYIGKMQEQVFADHREEIDRQLALARTI